MQTFTFSNINKTSFNISMHKSYHVPCLWPSVDVDDIEISLSAGIVADLYFAASHASLKKHIRYESKQLIQILMCWCDLALPLTLV